MMEDGRLRITQRAELAASSLSNLPHLMGGI